MATKDDTMLIFTRRHYRHMSAADIAADAYAITPICRHDAAKIILTVKSRDILSMPLPPDIDDVDFTCLRH